MTEELQTTNVDAVVAPAATPEAAPSATQTPPKATPKKPAAKTSSKTVDDKPKQTCAFCGKDAVFDHHQSVGGRPPLAYHGCAASEEALNKWFMATLADASAPAPQTSK